MAVAGTACTTAGTGSSIAGVGPAGTGPASGWERSEQPARRRGWEQAAPSRKWALQEQGRQRGWERAPWLRQEQPERQQEWVRAAGHGTCVACACQHAFCGDHGCWVLPGLEGQAPPATAGKAPTCPGTPAVEWLQLVAALSRGEAKLRGRCQTEPASEEVLGPCWHEPLIVVESVFDWAKIKRANLCCTHRRDAQDVLNDAVEHRLHMGVRQAKEESRGGSP